MGYQHSGNVLVNNFKFRAQISCEGNFIIVSLHLKI
jgi:hypothetical protein